MLLIERYMMAEVRRPLVTILAVLTFIFASYTFGRFLNDAAAGAIDPATALRITGYRILIALEILAPLALYASVVIGLGRLHHDREMIALASAGVGPIRTYRAIALLALPLALIVALLSVYGRPWSYAQAYALEARAQTDLNVNRLQADRFNVNPVNGRMIFARRVDAEDNRLHEVLIHDVGEHSVRLIRAKRAWLSDADPAHPVLELEDGLAYHLDQRGAQDQILEFEHLTLELSPVQVTPDYRRKAAATSELAASPSLPERAELQWRLSRGPTALLLALLAVPLSRTRPSGGRFANLLPVTLVFILIYYAGGVFKTLVEGGRIAVLPGVWWVPLLMAGALLILMLVPQRP